jgi:hypothetical protein
VTLKDVSRSFQIRLVKLVVRGMHNGRCSELRKPFDTLHASTFVTKAAPLFGRIKGVNVRSFPLVGFCDVIVYAEVFGVAEENDIAVSVEVVPGGSVHPSELTRT